MKNLYLILAVIGFIAPNVFVAIESIESGNYLLYSNPMETIQGMFANRISTIFMIDLLFTVLVFFTWTFKERKIYNIKNLWMVWTLTMLFGIAGGFPFFLYLRQIKIDSHNSGNS